LLDTDLNIEDTIKAICQRYLAKYDVEKFKTEILHELIVNWPQSLHWFRRQLSKQDKNYNEDQYWQEFLQDKDGNDIKNLRRFQLQLLLNNEFRKIQSTKTSLFCLRP